MIVSSLFEFISLDSFLAIVCNHYVHHIGFIELTIGKISRKKFVLILAWRGSSRRNHVDENKRITWYKFLVK